MSFPWTWGCPRSLSKWARRPARISSRFTGQSQPGKHTSSTLKAKRRRPRAGSHAPAMTLCPGLDPPSTSYPENPREDSPGNHLGLVPGNMQTLAPDPAQGLDSIVVMHLHDASRTLGSARAMREGCTPPQGSRLEVQDFTRQDKRKICVGQMDPIANNSSVLPCQKQPSFWHPPTLGRYGANQRTRTCCTARRIFPPI